MKKLRVSASLVKQGSYRFFTCTIPSEVLAKCCFVSTRDDDPVNGFQRLLDERRAQEIANYIDSGEGTIPSAIILSAQKESSFKEIAGGKTIEFNQTRKSFLIIDGQHRVWGFMKSELNLRVPVVIYSNLTRREETRLFIDINSKQRGVPNELLLDIKHLAELETDEQAYMREIFDYFNKKQDSFFYGSLSASKKQKGKLTRVTFNSGLKLIVEVLIGRDSDEVYEILNNYFLALDEYIDDKDVFLNTVTFKALCAFFPTVASRVKIKFGPEYDIDAFYSVLEDFFSVVKSSKLKSPGKSYKELVKYFVSCIDNGFSL